MDVNTGNAVSLKNVPTSFSDGDLFRALSPFGDVDYVSIDRDLRSRSSLGTALVVFKSAVSAELCRDVLSNQSVVLDDSAGPLQLLDSLSDRVGTRKSAAALFVSGLSEVSISDHFKCRYLERQLVELFAAFDDVVNVRLVPPGAAIVELQSLAKARVAMQTINWQGLRIADSDQLRVSFVQKLNSARGL